MAKLTDPKAPIQSVPSPSNPHESNSAFSGFISASQVDEVITRDQGLGDLFAMIKRKFGSSLNDDNTRIVIEYAVSDNPRISTPKNAHLVTYYQQPNLGTFYELTSTLKLDATDPFALGFNDSKETPRPLLESFQGASRILSFEEAFLDANGNPTIDQTGRFNTPTQTALNADDIQKLQNYSKALDGLDAKNKSLTTLDPKTEALKAALEKGYTQIPQAEDKLLTQSLPLLATGKNTGIA